MTSFRGMWRPPPSFGGTFHPPGSTLQVCMGGRNRQGLQRASEASERATTHRAMQSRVDCAACYRGQNWEHRQHKANPLWWQAVGNKTYSSVARGQSIPVHETQRSPHFFFMHTSVGCSLMHLPSLHVVPGHRRQATVRPRASVGRVSGRGGSYKRINGRRSLSHLVGAWSVAAARGVRGASRPSLSSDRGGAKGMA